MGDERPISEATAEEAAYAAMTVARDAYLAARRAWEAEYERGLRESVRRSASTPESAPH